MGRFAVPELAMERWGMKKVGGEVLMVSFPNLLAIVPTDRLPIRLPKLEAASYRQPTWVRHISQSSQIPLPPEIRDEWDLRDRKPAEIDIYDGYGDVLAVLPAGELQDRIIARLPNVPVELRGAIVEDVLASDWSILRQAAANQIIQAALPEIF
jgi:hypothetical protein